MIDMRGTLATLGVAVVALTAGAAVAAGATTINFTSVTRSQGDTKTGFISREDVLQGGKKVGTDVLRCTFAKGNARCRVTVTLPKGTVVGTFTIAESSSSGAIKVVDGTGAYADATGTGTFRNLNEQGTRTAVMLRLG
jgi:hypothetical protein